MTQFHAIIAFAILVAGLALYIFVQIAKERFEDAERRRVKEETLRNQRLRFEADRMRGGR